MSSLQLINPNADVVRRGQALSVNITAALGLQSVLRSNLGPKGTLKMLVSGSGDLKLTKDGKVLLGEMSIIHPTAAMIARAATAQDEITGDGTTSSVILIGELLRQAERYVADGVHPRVITDGFDMARRLSLDFLEAFKRPLNVGDDETLLSVARTALGTKVPSILARPMAEAVVGAFRVLKEEMVPDLHMVEVMKMGRGATATATLVPGLVMDHGTRHPDMPRRIEGGVHILSLNVSLEYEKTEVSSSFVYSTAEQRDRLVEGERRAIDNRVLRIIALKDAVCQKGEGFVLVNQQGIDPLSLDMLAHAGIMALRRAKRRNAERLVRACGCAPQNAVDGLTPQVLGWAERVYEVSMDGEDKFTFVEHGRGGKSATILVTGPTPHAMTQAVDAVRDGLRAVRNAVVDGAIVPGAGAFSVALYSKLGAYMEESHHASRLGVQAWADAWLAIPRILAANAGLDVVDSMVKLQAAAKRAAVGLNLNTGETMDPVAEGVWDNVSVLSQLISSTSIIASNLLLVDEIMRAGRSSLKPDQQPSSA